MNSDERRAQLLEIAALCFAELGYSKTTTARIAEDAGVTEPVLYRHFRGKRHLHTETIRLILGESQVRFSDTVADEPDGAKKLLAMVMDYPTFARDRRDRLRVIDRSLADCDEAEACELLKDYYEELIAATRDVVREGQSDDSITDDVDAEALAWMLVMAGIGYRMLLGLGVSGLESRRLPMQLACLVRSVISPCRDDEDGDDDADDAASHSER